MKTVHIYGDNRFERHTKVRAACRGVVIRDGKILLSYEVNTDQWMIPGGGIETEESEESCCVRELAEETGFLVKPLQSYLKIHEYYEDWLYTSSYFICQVMEQTESKLTRREKEVGMEPRWIPLEEAVSIFSKHQDYTGQEEKRGMYLREYLALTEYQNAVL